MKGYRDILRKNRNMLTGIGFVMVISAIFAVAAGYSLSWILNAYEAQGDRVRQLIFGITWLRGDVWTVYPDRIPGGFIPCMDAAQNQNDLRKIASRKLASLSYEEFYQKDSGAYVSWLGNDVDQLYTNAFEQLFSGDPQRFFCSFCLCGDEYEQLVSGRSGADFVCDSVYRPTADEQTDGTGDPTALSGDGAECGSLQGYHHGNRNLLSEQSAAESCGAIAVSSDKAEQQIFLSNRTVLYGAEFAITCKLQQSDRTDAGCHLLRQSLEPRPSAVYLFAVGKSSAGSSLTELVTRSKRWFPSARQSPFGKSLSCLS